MRIIDFGEDLWSQWPAWADAFEVETVFTVDPPTHCKFKSTLSIVRINKPSEGGWIDRDRTHVRSFELLFRPTQSTFSLRVVGEPRVATSTKAVAVNYEYPLLDRLPGPSMCAGSDRLRVRLIADSYNGLLVVSRDNAPLTPVLVSPFYFGVGETLMRNLRQRQNINVDGKLLIGPYVARLRAVAWNRSPDLKGKSVIEDARLNYDAMASPVRQPVLDLKRGATAVINTILS